MSWHDCLKEVHHAGYNAVEVNFDGLFELNCSTDTLREIRKVCRRYHLKVVSVYSREQWKTPISSNRPANRRKAERILSRLIEIAAHLGTPTVLTIPGAVDNSILSEQVEVIPYEVAYTRSAEALLRLARQAEKEGVVLAIENVANKFLLSPLEMRTFIEKIGSPSIGCHFDVANCVYTGGVPEQWIRILAKHIKAVHLKDYRIAAGNLVGFVNIFEGDINWDQVCRALAEVRYEGALISEVLPAYRYHPEVLLQSTHIAIDCLCADIEGYRHQMDACLH